MAKKKSFFGTLLKLGGLAAATAAVYYKRDEIKAFLADAAERIFPENAVIDAKADAAPSDDAEEPKETEEAAPAE